MRKVSGAVRLKYWQAYLNRKQLGLLVFAAAAWAGPGRIVSTTPSITEILFALEAGDRVVGVTTFCYFPPETARIAKIGSYTQLNLEAIVAARPDLVFVEKSPLGFTERLRAMGLRVEEVNAQSAHALPEAIRAIARAIGVSGEPLIAKIQTGLDGVRRSVRGRKRVMFVVGRSPGSLDGLMVAGPQSYLDEILSIAGGENVFASAKSSYPRVSLEEVFARRPEVIIDMGEMADTVGVTEDRKRAVVALWKKYPVVKARVFAVAEDYLVVPGPRVVDAAKAFARMLHD
ncbi:MAG: hypothetical protein FJW38_27225 [Acidobacteria bacterium]|nr:hypothetical protein [Acidobacteriota bacterium]